MLFGGSTIPSNVGMPSVFTFQ